MTAAAREPAAARVPRGIRNNNPGNIRRSGTRWKGQSAIQRDPAFVQFDSAIWGIRALARVLGTYRHSYGLNTVRGIITRWAPPSENDTEAYIAAVAKAVGVAAGAIVAWDAGKQRRLIKAIIQHENGQQPYSDLVIDAGIALAES